MKKTDEEFKEQFGREWVSACGLLKRFFKARDVAEQSADTSETAQNGVGDALET